MDRRTRIGVLFILLSTLGFGGIPTLSRLAYDAGLNVPTVLAIRFTSAALLGWPLLLARRQGALPPRRLLGLLLVSLVFVANTTSFFVAVRHAPASMVAVIFYTYPVMVAALSMLFLGERLTLPRGLALGLAMLGCLLTLEFDFSGVSGPGLAYAVASALFYAVYIVLSSRLARELPVAVASTWIMTGMALAFLAFGLATRTLRFDFEPRGWLVMLVMVLAATVLAVQLFLAGTLRLGPSRASILGSVEPVVAVALAAAILGEPLGPLQILGGLLVVAAVLVLRLPAAEPAPAGPSPVARENAPGT